MAVWRVLLNLSVSLLPTNGVAGIDASGFDRSNALKHYTKRAKLMIQQLKVTLLVDSKVNAIRDLHVTTTRKHDSEIAPSLIKRNPKTIDILLGDKGYDGQKIRRLARQHEIRPLIKHRELTPLQGMERTLRRRPLRPTESTRDSQLNAQAEVRCPRPFTTLVKAVP